MTASAAEPLAGGPGVGPRAAGDGLVVVTSTAAGAQAAAAIVEGLRAGLAGRAASAVLWFAGADHDPAVLAPVLEEGLPGAAVAGCSGAGPGVTAVALPADVVVGCDAVLVDLAPDGAVPGASATCADDGPLEAALGTLAAASGPLHGLDPARHVLLALLAAPGVQDALCDRLGAAAPALEVVGGCAAGAAAGSEAGTRADGWVSVGGRVVGRGAVLLLVASAVPFVVLTTAAFTASGRHLAVTRTDASGRVVREFDHLPAVEAYADAVGIETDSVDGTVFGRHPLGVVVDGVPFPRTPHALVDDGSLVFATGLRPGVDLEVADAADLVRTTDAALGAAVESLGGTTGAVLFDSVRRRDRAASDGVGAAYDAVLARLPAAVHVGPGQLRLGPVDTCLVGVVLGRPAAGRIRVV